MDVKVFEIIESMIGDPCVDCGSPVQKDGVLVVHNIPGGNMAPVCRSCYDALDSDES